MRYDCNLENTPTWARIPVLIPHFCVSSVFSSMFSMALFTMMLDNNPTRFHNHLAIWGRAENISSFK